MQSERGSIRTPDQRLRIFVSSTLKELAAERKACRTAIERLRLAPVMFELGARPHPPRDLYRAYLEASDIFVGLYWERYGWVAPGESVSGLEDEYNLAPQLPKLIYIKETDGSREERLLGMLDRIRTDDTASFKYFSTARELGTLLQDDLAIMLAERFDQSRPRGAPGSDDTRGTPGSEAAHGGEVVFGGEAATGERPATDSAAPGDAAEERPLVSLPPVLTELIGRQGELDTITGMLRDSGVRLLTLTGPGGIGKSRLAIGVAAALADQFRDGVVFVDLAPIHDSALVAAAIAAALGVRDSGDGPLVDKILTSLRHRNMLLVIDNFEQVVDAAPLLLRMLGAAADLRLVVTSRILLRLSAEHSVEVGPLALIDLARRPTLAEIAASPAVALFVERVHAVKPDFELSHGNVEAVVRICAALDGVPLALELAAARVRVLPPAEMLKRMDKQLPLLQGGIRDLPERQQTLRHTIQWSTQLLGEPERALLAMLGVFDGGFSLDAVEALAAASSAASPASPASSAGAAGLGSGSAVIEGDPLSLLSTLVDSSLVRQQDRGERSQFSMLATVREYALEQLEAGGTLQAMRDAHARYFVGLAEKADPELEGALQGDWVAALADTHNNLRATARYLLDSGDFDGAASFAWDLYIYWWVGGHMGEIRNLMDEVLTTGQPVDDRSRAIALYFTRATTFWLDPDNRVIPGLQQSAELFGRAGDPSGKALALISLALAQLAAATPDPAAADDALETSLTLFRDAGDTWGQAMALVTLGRVALLQQKIHAALNRFEESLSLTELQHDALSATIARNHVGWARLLLEDVDAARDAFQQGLISSARLGHDDGVAYGLEGLVAVAATTHDVERAGRLLGAAQCLRELSGIYNAQPFSFHQHWIEPLESSAEFSGRFAAALEAGRALTELDALRYAVPELEGSAEQLLPAGSRAW